MSTEVSVLTLLKIFGVSIITHCWSHERRAIPLLPPCAGKACYRVKPYLTFYLHRLLLNMYRKYKTLSLWSPQTTDAPTVLTSQFEQLNRCRGVLLKYVHANWLHQTNVMCVCVCVCVSSLELCDDII
jgi:hypothetical protein